MEEKKSTYWKGHSKDSQRGRRVAIEIFAEPQDDLLDPESEYKNIAEVTYLEDGSVTFAATMEELEERFCLSKRISEEEHTTYVCLARLSTALYLSRITGGFPRRETAVDICKKLPDLVQTVVDQQRSTSY